MFRYLRLKRPSQVEVPLPGRLSREELARDATHPISLRRINELPENARKRIYRLLLPTTLLAELRIDPITWKGPGGDECIHLEAPEDAAEVRVLVRDPFHREEACVILDLADNNFGGIDLNWLVTSDPASPRFDTDRDETGQSTLFGTVRRNLAAEEAAMQVGYAPGQVRRGLRSSRQIIAQLDSFLATLGHRSYALEPLTYAAAWVFERRGFAYVRGHSMMDEIHREFQPGGVLHRVLDNSSVFRHPDHWRTVRGRAWAIHDGILEVCGMQWNNLRMIKQVGHHAGVETFPGAIY